MRAYGILAAALIAIVMAIHFVEWLFWGKRG